MKHAVRWLMFAMLAIGSCLGVDESAQTKVPPDGDSVLVKNVGGTAIRIVMSTYKADVVSAGQATHKVRKTNCTHPSRPCSQVSDLNIRVDGKKLFVPRSVFADRADVGILFLTSASGLNVLTFAGGDGSEAYTVKVFFDSHRVVKRELYWNEGSSLDETTTYMPLAALK